MPETIATEPLTQMLKSIALQKRTGLLQIERLGEKNTERGEIYFEGGRPIRARTGQEGGQKAFQCMCEWKQITCSFHGMSRPYPVNTRVLAVSKDQQVEVKWPARPLPSEVPQTEKLASSAESFLANGKAGRFVPSGERTSLSQTSQPIRIVAVANNRAVTSPARSNQPLILHGARLEKYTPAPPARPSHATGRWTTHQVSELETLPMPRKPPVTPHLGPLPGEEVLPGRTAIFKVRAMVATAQAIQRMERRERIVFILLDGHRTIQDIAHLTHQAEYDVEQILVYLTRAGYAQYVRG